jgi:hypothetical protein
MKRKRSENPTKAYHVQLRGEKEEEINGNVHSG